MRRGEELARMVRRFRSLLRYGRERASEEMQGGAGVVVEGAMVLDRLLLMVMTSLLGWLYAVRRSALSGVVRRVKVKADLERKRGQRSNASRLLDQSAPLRSLSALNAQLPVLPIQSIHLSGPLWSSSSSSPWIPRSPSSTTQTSSHLASSPTMPSTITRRQRAAPLCLVPRRRLLLRRPTRLPSRKTRR